ncbi:MAG: hotdog fold thioesterase [Acidimicrobiia bacterium]|nr:hotdog fold thioesterase [Acidimicrobiia bacterium]
MSRRADEITGGMYSADNVAELFDMSVIDVDIGTATVEMTVTDEMTNGLDVCHGGIIFTLADTAMAYASNAGDHSAVSTTASIEWLRPAHTGDRLTATSRPVAVRGRNTVHDVVVARGDGEVVALVRAHTLMVDPRPVTAEDGT